MEWEAAILKKKAQRTASIQKFSRLEKSAERSTFAERLVGNVDVPTLTKLYAEGNITVEDIVVAFIARGASCFSQMALLTSSETNCLTEVLFENALQQARELDRYHRQHRELIGPLHGVPVSLKDQFDIAGVDTTFGYVGRSFQPASKDATVTKILKDLGAVILTKTNVPQTILSSRISHRGVPGPHEGQEHVPSSVGPMSKRLTSLVTVTRAVLNAQAWLSDPKVVPIPWREGLYLEVQTRRLKIGLILDDGIVKPHPPVERAVKEAAALLRNAGHEVIIWDTSEHMGFIEIQDQFYRADGGEDIRRDISAGGEPMIPHVEALVESSKAISVYEYWQLNKAKMLAQQAYNEKWTKSGVDVLLSPVAGHTALPHRCFRYTGYTKIWNFLDYTAMSFPFTRVSEDLDSDHISRTSGTDTSALDEVRNPLDTYNQGLWDLASMKGLPVGVQIIGRRFDEEKVLGVAKVLEKEIEKQKQV
ncbi:hypothetical protein HRR78_007196 [Exophiala dermatitidis]|nr:hypothetical protein HRR75_008621 [Exophiala dermatitidis]KAJ4541918.1 hypothetical protein HRR78_007196 [Exophiala dermatitidis]